MQRLSRAGALLPGIALTLLAACQGDQPQSPEAAIVPEVPAGTTGLDMAPFGLAPRPLAGLGRACRDASYRQFDFWVGQWEIVDFSSGEAADGGDDIITSELGGCAVFENYAGGGFRGRSINTFDPSTGQWYQHWVDNSSLTLDLVGSFAGGHMRLEGDRPTPAGGTLHDRIDWTALASDRVRQLWEVSADGGVTYPTVQFDGLYQRRSSVTLDAEVPTAVCQDPAFPAPRQLDFTLGRWSVQLSGPLARGHGDLRSSISTDLSACLLEERITGDDGYEARVFSSARRRTGQWYRTFIDNRGVRVFLTGREEAGKVVLRGKVPAGGATSADVRVTWEQLNGGRFRQRWELTRDGGATWQGILDATYRPR
jgi:hypothetical protein